jgi:Family of unknown function (DUF5681)
MTELSEPNYAIGYKKPPTATRFKKGQSGNPHGRPKRPEGISISEVLDSKQRGKNGELISSREAIVIRLLNNAMSGNQKAFAKFLNLMITSGLLRNEAPISGGRIIRFPTDPRASPSPKTYAEWLRKEGRHEEANTIDPP